MAKLGRFKTEDALTVPIEALAADDPAVWLRAHHDFPAEDITPERSIDALESLLEEATSRYRPFDASVDTFLAPRIHAVLPLSRGEAADRKLWGWLGLTAFPEYVAHRWKPIPKAGLSLRSKERFAGSKVRQTFARLWWAGELTRSPEGDYSLTEELFGLPGIQDVYEAIFGRAFCGHYPALRAFIVEVGPAREKVVRETAKEFSNVLTTVVLEALTESDHRALLKDIRSNVEEMFRRKR